MASQFGKSVKQTVKLIPALRQVPMSQIRTRIAGAVKRRWKKLRAKVSRNTLAHARVRLADRFSGPRQGNRTFWQSRLASSVYSVEARLFTLFEDGHTEALQDFVKTALLQAPGAVVIMVLTRSAITQGIVISLLRDPQFLDQMVERSIRSAQVRAGLSAAAAFLLEPDEIDGLQKKLAAPNLRQTTSTALLIDSFSTTPYARPTVFSGTVANAISRKPARHRLIISSNLGNLTRLSLLFAGAEKVSLFSPTNLYGRASLPDNVRLHFRPEKLVIAHPRSRATRFSTAYHRLHDETRLLAEEVMEDVRAQSDGRLDEALPYMTLSLADSLFFRALPIVGLNELLADPEIDQILIVTPETANQKYLALFSELDDLAHDPRVEIVSLAPSESARIDFTRSFSTAFHRSPKPLATSAALARPLVAGLESLAAEAAATAGNMPPPWQSDSDASKQARVMFITAADSAYNTASATYADILNRHFNLFVGIIGSNPFAIFNSVPGIVPPSPSRLQMLPTQTKKDRFVLEYALRHILEGVGVRNAQQGRFPVVSRILQAESASLAQDPMSNALFHWHRLLHWFGQMVAAQAKPDVVVLSPLRPTMVGLAAAAARRFRIPSFALEPHIINAEYCRYTRVMTDRYGTPSRYLAKLAEEGFSIPADRIDVVGSPRLVATPAVPPQAARLTLEQEGQAHFPQGMKTLLFFSQPSNWDQIAEVWQMILVAMRPHEGMQILLKMHPEEGELRRAGYLNIAESLGLSNRVQSASAPPPLLIQASDLVLACYSATLVEAGLAGRPVMSVINKGARYPMEQHKVVGAPQFDDAESLSAALAEFNADPQPSHDRIARFLEENPQFVTGPEPHLVAAINAIVAADPETILRPAADLPPRLFIEGPYRVYDV